VKLSLRLRLTLVFALGTALVLAGLGWFLYVRLGNDLMSSLDLSLRTRAQDVQGALARNDQGVLPGKGSLVDPDEAFVQIVEPSGAILAGSTNTSGIPLVGASALAGVTRPTSFTRTIAAIDADPVRLLVVPSSRQGRPVFVIVGATLGDRQDAMARLLVSLGIGGPVALLLTSAAGWMVAGGALRPVERIRREAAAISVSEPARRLPVPSTGDELERLGTTLNSMLDRLQQAFDRERRFVDDASHELRTPLGILKMELDLALARSRTPEELEAALRGASEETDRIVRLSEDLLVLARSEGGRLPTSRTEVELPATLAQAVAPYQDRARAGGGDVRLDAEAGTVSVDPVRLRQAVQNLLENALRYTPPEGVVTVRATHDGNTVRIDVEDEGPGFPEGFASKAFEPFTRAEGEADRNGSGAGLGLTIVRAVAEAHGGTVEASNLPLGGARLTLTLRG
jgi:heavy metal sensor kinase